MAFFIIITAILFLFFLGLHIMNGIDSFLETNYPIKPKDISSKKPSSILLTNQLSNEELLHEIEQFCKEHEYTKIILYDEKDTHL